MSVLLVEDQEHEANTVARRLKGAWSASVVVAPDGDAALRELDARQFDLVIADEGLPDVSGMDLLATTRIKQPHAYRAMLTGTFKPDLVHRAGMIDAFFMCKPAVADAFDEVMKRAERRRSRRIALMEHIERMAAAWRLSTQERRILMWLVDLRTREEWCEAHSVRPSTFDTHVKNIRAKMPGNDRMDRLVQRLLLDVIKELQGPEP